MYPQDTGRPPRERTFSAGLQIRVKPEVHPFGTACLPPKGRHHMTRVLAKSVIIFVVEYQDKQKWQFVSNTFHTREKEAYLQQEGVRQATPGDCRYRVRKFVEAE